MAWAMGAATALIAGAPAHAGALEDLATQLFGHHKQTAPKGQPITLARTGGVSLGDVLFNHRQPMPQRTRDPPVGLYRDDDGDPAFVLDRSSSVTVVRFEGSPEVWVLTAQPASRGDVIYRNDAGETMLRATRVGGLTLYTVEHPGGAPVALVEEAQPIHPNPPPQTQVALGQRLAWASARASAGLQRTIVFEGHDPTPETAPAMADAALVTAIAITEIAKRPDGKRTLMRLVKVSITGGRRVSVILVNGVLEIAVAPTQGAPFGDILGRPSSRRVEIALSR